MSMTVRDYNQCVDKHADALYRFILKNIKNEDKARDIVQDSFEKLWVKCSEVDAEKAKSYLFATGYHAMIDMIRRDKKMAPIEDGMTREIAGRTDSYTGLQEVLQDALSRLPADQRSVVLLRDYEGYSYEEIAQITGLSEAQVKVYIYRGRVHLKNYIRSMETVI
jgi:RNA polymerase sigma factor (sigma-70 family)